VRVWLAPPTFQTSDLDSIVDAIIQEWPQHNRRPFPPRSPDGRPNARVVPFIALRNSPVLADDSFAEVTVGYAAVVMVGRYLFLSDSGGETPKAFEEFEVLAPEALQRAVPQGVRVSSVSLENNDVGARAIRGRSVRAHDLWEIASEIGESTYFCNSAQASLLNEEDRAVRRYIGTRYGRVSESGGSTGSFDSFYKWVTSRAKDFRSDRDAAKALTRYATSGNLPDDPAPAHVLLDLFNEAFVNPSTGNTIIVDEAGSDVAADGAFSVVIDQVAHQARIRFDSIRKRYEVSSESLDLLSYRSALDGRMGLIQLLNRQQAFRLVTASGGVYSAGRFWSLGSRATSRDGIFDILTPVDELAKAHGEKWDWGAGSAFEVVETKLVPDDFQGDYAGLLCTDMGNEPADFIAWGKKRVAFVHAKSKSLERKDEERGGVAPSALHEVVSQAIKNLRYLTLGNVERPQTGQWVYKWPNQKSALN
jgi:hypothetical protein